MVGERELGRGARDQRALESACPGIPSTGCQKLRAGAGQASVGGKFSQWSWPLREESSLAPQRPHLSDVIPTAKDQREGQVWSLREIDDTAPPLEQSLPLSPAKAPLKKKLRMRHTYYCALWMNLIQGHFMTCSYFHFNMTWSRWFRADSKTTEDKRTFLKLQQLRPPAHTQPAPSETHHRPTHCVVTGRKSLRTEQQELNFN